MNFKFDITGMTCAACSARVEKVTEKIPGVRNVQVNLLSGIMTLDADDRSVTDAVIAAVTNAGYGAALHGEKKKEMDDRRDELRSVKCRIIISGIFLSVLMYFTMGHMLHLPTPFWYQGPENALVAALLQFLLTIPVVYLNRAYYKKGFKALWNRAPNMDSLIAVGSGAALLYGVAALFCMAFAMGHNDLDTVGNYRENLYFESAAMILTLITVGKFLESRAKGKTGDAIRKLMDLSPKTATVRINGEEKIIPVEQVSVGDVVIVRSGGSIPADGTVILGRAAVDQSALTGESVPAEKGPGDTVTGATVVTEGYLELRADKVGVDTVLSQVIRLVETAGGSKAPIARLADKIAGVFVPAVMAISFLTFAVWLIAKGNLEFSLNAAISVLVISCPCALGLATPVAIMVGTGRGANMGVLFKSAEALENLHKIDTVVLDKTGTLTVGKPVVTDVRPFGIDKSELLRIAAALEARSEHPFAKAIIAYCGSDGYEKLEDFQTLPGQGVSAVIDGTQYYGGNLRLMEDIGISAPRFDEWASQGKTPLYFASADGVFLGAIAAADVLKEDSADAVEALKRLSVEVIMLTGDNSNTAMAIGAKAGIANVIAGVLPGDKAGVIEKLRAEGRNVLMVGDGINDAPALVTADVGMAVGSGTDIAIESADVVLMQHSLYGVCNAVMLSKAVLRNIKQNLFWAFFYNCLGIPIAAGVLYPGFGIQLSPMIGAAAMSLSSVFVVTNALRLRFFQSASFMKPGGERMKEQEKINMETVIKVNGMMCPHCKARVEAVCKGISGVQDAVVDLEQKNVTVIGDAPLAALQQAIMDAGYEVMD